MSVVGKNEGAAPWPASAPSIKNELLYDPSIAPIPKISNREAAQFLNLLAEDEQLTFQTFDDKKGRHASHLVHVLHGTLDQHFPLLSELNGRGAGIFFTVNATDLKGRETKNITKVRAVFVDLDGAPLEPILSAPLSPHIVVESSPNRFHAYWLIDGLPLEQFSLVQKALIQRFNANRAVHDLPRVMRLPGFFHRKGSLFWFGSLNTRPLFLTKTQSSWKHSKLILQLSYLQKLHSLAFQTIRSFKSFTKEEWFDVL